MGLIERLVSLVRPPAPPRGTLRQPVQLHAIDPTVAAVVDSYQEPILQMTQTLPGRGMVHETQMLLWHAMRQYSPTLDAALKNRRTLEGAAVPESDDEGLQRDLEDFVQNVAVGYLGGRASLRGLDTYLGLLADYADEYGLTAGEIQTDEEGRELRRLVVPNPRTLYIRRDEARDEYGLYQRRRGENRRLDDKPLVQVFALGLPTEGPWPAPLAWSAVKSTEAILRMVESVINGWWRFGDPSLLMGLEFDAEAHVDLVTATDSDGAALTDASGAPIEVPAALLRLKETLDAVMQGRRRGLVGDAYASVQGGKVVNQVLGAVDAGLMRYFREQSSVFDGHVVGLSRTPIWMYPSLVPGRSSGLGGNLAHSEAIIAAVDARRRNGLKERMARQVIDMFLLVTGSARHVGRYRIEWDEVALLDDKLIADTRLTDAQADERAIANAVQLFEEDGTPRFAGEADRYLREQGVLPEEP